MDWSGIVMVLIKKKNPIIKRIFQVLLDKNFEGAFINQVYQDDYTLYANFHLPEHRELADLEEILPNLQQEVGATAVKIGKQSGKYVEVKFGMRKLEELSYSNHYLHADSLKVEFPSAYGKHIIDFEDGASCHMLNGGVTRMGKTCFLLYLATILYLQNNGHIRLYINSAKLKDYYPFNGLTGVKMGKNEAEMMTILQEILAEYKKRNDLLYSPSFRKATDAKSIHKLYPDQYHLFEPIFLIVDEYARFANSQDIQKMVTEIVETAGFVNVHVIIASQRPDASSVLKPRIRANLLTRLAFTTADRKNSEVILDREGAEHLGRIAGRGLLIDSDSHIIQVPYLDVIECDKLLEPYRKEWKEDEQSTEGSTITQATDKIQSLLTESVSLPHMQEQLKTSECSEQSIETYGDEWSDYTSTKGKR